MTGTLYVIGVGPGDPELLTLKAVKLLSGLKVLCVPKGREEGTSLALEIVRQVLPLEGKEIIELHFPMHKNIHMQPDLVFNESWHKTVEMLVNRLNQGIDLAFITIGDPAIYSTFFYLYDKLLEINPDCKVVIIPGVSSINAAAASAGISLGRADEKIAIIPVTYVDEVKDILEDFDTVVLMKVYKVFERVKKAIEELGLLEHTTYIARVGMKDERIRRNIGQVQQEDLNYFSMIIVKKTGGRK